MVMCSQYLLCPSYMEYKEYGLEGFSFTSWIWCAKMKLMKMFIIFFLVEQTHLTLNSSFTFFSFLNVKGTWRSQRFPGRPA